MSEEPTLSVTERHTLGSLRYAVNDEAATYVAVMRLFTTGMTGFLSDLSAVEVAERLARQGCDLEVDTVDVRLSYLVEHGNLARSPRESEAKSVREYLTNRARYQLTQRGELVQRQLEELLGHTESAREVSSEMLGGILAGLEQLDRAAMTLSQAEPQDLATVMTTVFAQFELLVTSTRQFYAYLSQVLTRYDLGRDEFQMFKGVLLDYLQRFVDDISRHMPQIADRLRSVEANLPALCERANAGQRLVGLDGTEARRSPGLAAEDWASIHAWFVGAAGRTSDADNVRGLATEAMRALLVNLRRIATSADREQSRFGDLLNLARWFDAADDGSAHELWTAAFGLYSARHLQFLADGDDDPVPATATWWRAPVAEVPVGLRTYGERKLSGRSGAREDFSAAKAAQLQARHQAQERRSAALRELARHRGEWRDVQISDEARTVLLDLYSRAVTGRGRPLTAGDSADIISPVAPDETTTLCLAVSMTPGRGTVVHSPHGRLTMVDLTLRVDLHDESRASQEVGA